MRAYFFNLQPYISGIQHGIQAGHAMESMWLKYTTPKVPLTSFRRSDATLTQDEKDRADHLRTLQEFAQDYKTWIILGNGDHEMQNDLFAFMRSVNNHYPWSYFVEPGLNNSLTSIAIVLPERLYDKAAANLGKAVSQLDWIDDRNGACHAASAWKDRMAADSFEACQTRLYTAWEVEFLKRKHRCNLAS